MVPIRYGKSIEISMSIKMLEYLIDYFMNLINFNFICINLMIYSIHKYNVFLLQFFIMNFQLNRYKITSNVK